MVQVDIPVAFAIGSLFADAAARQLRSGKREYFYSVALHNNIYQIFFFSWIPVYFLLNYFGWETTHMWWHADTVAAYPWFIPIFMVVFFAAVNLGFLLGNSLVTRGRLWTNRAVYLAIGVYSLIWILSQPGRTLKLGTYAEWKAGIAPWFYEDSYFFAVVAGTIILWAVVMAIYVVKLRKQGEGV